MKTKLVVVGGRATKREVVLELPASIGRHSEAALTVIHPTVSRNHCELVEVDGRVVLRDLGSTNGTFVADQRITEVVLDPGGRFTIGPLTFTAEYEPVNGAAGHPSVAPELRFDTPAAVVETLVQPATDDNLSLQDDDDLALAPLDSAVDVEPAAPTDDLQFDWDADDLPLDAVEDEADSAELSFNQPAAEEDSAVAESDEFDLQLAPADDSLAPAGDNLALASDADDDLGFAIGDSAELVLPAAIEAPHDEPLSFDESLSLDESLAFDAGPDESSRDMSINDLLLDDIPLAEAPIAATPLPDAAAANDALSLGEEDAFGWELTPSADNDLPSLGLAATDSANAESAIAEPAEADLPPLASDDEDLRFLLEDPESVPPISHEPDLSLADELALDDQEIAEPAVESVEFDLAMDDDPLALADESDASDELAIGRPLSESPSSESLDLQIADDKDEFLLAEPAGHGEFGQDLDEPLSLEEAPEELSLEPLDLHVADESPVEDELTIEPLELADAESADSLEFQLEDDDLAPLAELRDVADELPPLVPADEPAAEPVKMSADAEEELALDLDVEEDGLGEFDLDDLDAPASGIDSLSEVDSPEALVPEELALDTPELEGLAIEERAPISLELPTNKPLPTGPVEPWEMDIAEPIVTDASHLVDALPAIPADELDYLDFDEPAQPIEATAAPTAAQPADQHEPALQLPTESPSIQDAEEDFFLDLDPVDSSPAELGSPVEFGSAELNAPSGSLDLDELLDESLDLPESSPVAMDFDEPESELTETAAAPPTPTADKAAASAKEPAKKAMRGWWPFGGKKQAKAAESAALAASQPAAAEPELTETINFNETESELVLGDEPSLDSLESLALAPDEQQGLEQLRAPKVVDNFDLDEFEGDEELSLDLPATSADLEGVADVEFDESLDFDEPSARETQAVEIDSLPTDDPLAGLEEKESMLLEEIEQGGASLDLGGSPDLTETLDLSETVEFVPSDVVPLETKDDAAATTEPAAKMGFRWWPFGRKGPAAPKPPKVKKEKVKKEKVTKEKKKKDKQGAEAPATTAIPDFDSAEPAAAGEVEELELSFDDDATGLAPLDGGSNQAFSEDDALDFLSDDAPAAKSGKPGKSAGPANQQPQTTGKPSGELSDLDLDEFLKGM